MKPLIAANWKLHKLPSEMDAWVKNLQAALKSVDMERLEIALCAPYTHLPALRQALKGSPIKLGAQDVSAHHEGAYTGEVAAPMLKDLGVHYVIVGHSERRAHHHEDDALVRAKVAAVREAGPGLVPILCVGETLAERESGEAEAVVLRQLGAALEGVTLEADTLVVAYEPVWAIGTGKTATDEDAQAMCRAVRGKLKELTPAAGDVRILYGGSMKGANAAGLLAQPDIGGGLIGSASLDAASLAEIAAAC